MRYFPCSIMSLACTLLPSCKIFFLLWDSFHLITSSSPLFLVASANFWVTVPRSQKSLAMASSLSLHCHQHPCKWPSQTPAWSPHLVMLSSTLTTHSHICPGPCRHPKVLSLLNHSFLHPNLPHCLSISTACLLNKTHYSHSLNNT